MHCKLVLRQLGLHGLRQHCDLAVPVLSQTTQSSALVKAADAEAVLCPGNATLSQLCLGSSAQAQNWLRQCGPPEDGRKFVCRQPSENQHSANAQYRYSTCTVTRQFCSRHRYAQPTVPMHSSSGGGHSVLRQIVLRQRCAKWQGAGQPRAQARA
jgi:hypothetical protein